MRSFPAFRPVSFVPLPAQPCLRLAWPTPNRFLFDAPERFFARTRANPRFGRPGWTRDCGRRFHRGCDIAPVEVVPTGRSTTVHFTDCATGREYPSLEPTFLPLDPVFSVFDGVVVEAVDDPDASDFGRHVVIRHAWPETGDGFHTLYAHLDCLEVRSGQAIAAGHRLGIMGATSRLPDARNWMAIAPHLHLEIRDARGRPFDPEQFLYAHLAR